MVVEVGGGIRWYTDRGRPVLDPYPLGAMCDGAHGTPLIPWPNRLADGRYRFDGIGPGYPIIEIYTGDTLAPARRRLGLGAEPMSCPPNAFQTVPAESLTRGSRIVRAPPRCVPTNVVPSTGAATSPSQVTLSHSGLRQRAHRVGGG
jgi:hypothetical protein